MPFSSNTKNDEFGHAQVLRDIENLYLHLTQYGVGISESIEQSGMAPVSQEVSDDGIVGVTIPKRLFELEQLIRNIRIPEEEEPVLIKITRGNKIAEYGSGPTTVYGLKYNATSIASVLAGEIDTGNVPKTSGMDEGYQTGLCYGSIIVNGLATTTVYVANKATPYGGSAQQDVSSISTLPENALVWAQRFVFVQKDGDPSILLPVYLVWRL